MNTPQPSTPALQVHPNVKTVATFQELVSTPFANGINALCWQRQLPVDEAAFNEIVAQLGSYSEITTLDEEDLQNLTLSPAAETARQILLEDQRLLREHGLSPILDCIPAYPKEEDPGPVPIDVYSFHADSSTIETDTYLCSYNVASSEGLPNADALRRIDIPETRAALLKLYGGKDDASFQNYLNEHCFDLHYLPKTQAQPYAFGFGNLWRIATQWPGSPVPPCIHRAPTTQPNHPARLLLIS